MEYGSNNKDTDTCSGNHTQGKCFPSHTIGAIIFISLNANLATKIQPWVVWNDNIISSAILILLASSRHVNTQGGGGKEREGT